jgi:TPP-dependent pyruvate/acetoin dehydrogenase alpha subunit
MFGDGASNTGNFGETMNLAALWRLPVVFLVENNLYGMGTALERHSAVTDLSRKAEGFGVPGAQVDGMDVIAVREAVAERLRMARDDRLPTLLEAFTYRYRGHSAADPEVYREDEEVEQWRRRDPIETFARRLTEAGVIGEGDLDGILDEVEARVVSAVEFADSSPEPELESLYEDLYVLGDQIRGWYSVDERTPDIHAGENERRLGASGRIRELAEAGAAYGGQPLVPPAGARREGNAEVAEDRDEAEGRDEAEDGG